MSAPTDGAGPYPLAIVLHGSHQWCAASGTARVWPCAAGTEVPNYEGLGYLTEALARRGFVAIAPGVNSAFALPADSGARVDVIVAEINRALEVLRTGRPARGLDPSAVDFSHVVLVGHSRGAALAAVVARPDTQPGLTVRVSGLVLLAPSDDTVDPSRLADLPTVVAIGTCDGDTGVGGGAFVAGALSASRTAPAALVMLDGATHNATNDRLAPDRPLTGQPGCGPSQLLAPAAQRQRLADLVPEWASQVLGGPGHGPTARLFDPLRPDDAAASGIRVVHVDPTVNRHSLLPRAGAPLVSNGSSTSGFVSVWCPPGLTTPFRVPGTEACHRRELADLVGRPPGYELTWDAAGRALTVPSDPAVAANSTGASPAVLVLRALPDPIDTRLGVGPVLITLSGSGSAGLVWNNEISVPVAAVGRVDVEAFVARPGALLWSERRLPIPAGLRSISISVRSPAAGSLLLVSLEVVVL